MLHLYTELQYNVLKEWFIMVYLDLARQSHSVQDSSPNHWFFFI